MNVTIVYVFCIKAAYYQHIAIFCILLNLSCKWGCAFKGTKDVAVSVHDKTKYNCHKSDTLQMDTIVTIYINLSFFVSLNSYSLHMQPIIMSHAFTINILQINTFQNFQYNISDSFCNNDACAL